MLPGDAADQWMVTYDDTKALVDDVLSSVQERNLKYPNGGPEASRITASARRKLGTLSTSIEALQKKLEDDKQISETERNRRRNLVSSLRTRREQLQQSLKRGEGAGSRGQLLDAAGSSRDGRAAETEATAGLENSGILQLQREVMRQQDQELEELEKTVNSTKHVALSVNEELTLHTRLLEELDEEVDVTHSRMRAAHSRLRHVMQKSGGCKSSCLLVLLVAGLVVVIVLGFKLAF